MADESPKKNIIIPEGFPDHVFSKVQKELRSTASRALVFQDRGQRSTAFIKKGITKPGKISYDTLRRAAMSVHVVRICINHLKLKVDKTKWVVRNKDIRKRVTDESDKRIAEITKLFRHPNTQDNFRSLIDKMTEDLLVLDAVSLEKTRYPDSSLAQIHYVDSATIRPVFNEFGEQDILIPLATEDAAKAGKGTQELPVSYVQVMNNSQYGGPESGDIVAAWPKRDFVHFHMSPQGAMESYGYGLSPIEGILSVVANLLNADNFNSTYFEEGAFPPIVLQLIGQVNQRDLEAYREYLVAELTGNFHRPAIMATEKAESLQIHNLKDMTNRDMQFMEYQDWLARLCCAMYGIAPQDIGITSDVNRATADVQQEISESKGYASILRLFEEQFNENILWDDFGYEDLEFAFVNTDVQDPKEQAETFDKRLRNGTMTLNEARERAGEAPYGDWADEPMILVNDGYVPIDPEAKAAYDDEQMERKQSEMEHKASLLDNEKPDIEKSSVRPLYMYRSVKNAEELVRWAKSQGFSTTVRPEDMHVTVAFSKTPVDWYKVGEGKEEVSIIGGTRSVEKLGNAVVLRFDSPELQRRWKFITSIGASWDYDSYKPHITITFQAGDRDISEVEPFDGVIRLGQECRDFIKEDWAGGIVEKKRTGFFRRLLQKIPA